LQNLNEYKQAQKKIIPTGNEEKDAVVTGLIQKRTNLEKAKTVVDKSYHKGIDGQIDLINQKIEHALNSDNPTFVESDDLTGEHNANGKVFDGLSKQEKDGIVVQKDFGDTDTEEVGQGEEKRYKPKAFYYETKGDNFKIKHEIETGDKTYTDKKKHKK
jgi:hypothetical protein